MLAYLAAHLGEQSTRKVQAPLAMQAGKVQNTGCHATMSQSLLPRLLFACTARVPLRAFDAKTCCTCWNVWLVVSLVNTGLS